MPGPCAPALRLPLVGGGEAVSRTVAVRCNPEEIRDMDAFIHETLPARVVFGADAAGVLRDEVDRIGCSRPMILTTPFQEELARTMARALVGLETHVFAEAAMHTPMGVTEKALAKVERAGADVLIAVGGGSAIGLAKALAIRTDLPQIAIPTTYAGSEATPILGETIDGSKVTQRSARVLPEVVLYDVALTLTLPPRLSVTSGFNAIAHAAEALYAQDRSPVIEMLAVDGIRALGRALPTIATRPLDVEARSDALYGAWACGVCLGNTQMALHHKLCHALGGTFDLPHAELHGVLLPHSLAYNASAAPNALRSIADALGVDDAPTGLWRMLRSLGAPSSLEQIGMPASGLDEAANAALERQYSNPEPLTRTGILALLDRAFHGRPPN